MLTLEPRLPQDQDFLIQDEPALEIALPQVFAQPPLRVIHKGKLADVQALVANICQRHRAEPNAALGRDYQELIHEFQPLFTWAISCWDYLLSTEGCKFVLRHGEQKFGARSDYRAFSDKDYSRMVHALFRKCI